MDLQSIWTPRASWQCDMKGSFFSLALTFCPRSRGPQLTYVFSFFKRTGGSRVLLFGLFCCITIVWQDKLLCLVNKHHNAVKYVSKPKFQLILAHTVCLYFFGKEIEWISILLFHDERKMENLTSLHYFSITCVSLLSYIQSYSKLFIQAKLLV